MRASAIVFQAPLQLSVRTLELRPPEGTDWAALKPLIPVFLTYALSFAYLGIYWNNHHHLFQAATRVTGPVLWANLNLLFWLSLFPFATGWMGDNHAATVPTIATTTTGSSSRRPLRSSSGRVP